MAPSTRLRAEPARRVQYADPTGRQGSRGNPIAVEDTPQLEPAAAPRKRAARKPAGKSPALTVPRTRAGAVAKPKEPSRKPVVVKKSKKKREPPAKRECSICASTKGVATCFRLDGHAEACEHFENTCGQCIQKMVSVKMSQRQLAEAELACPVSGCAHVLDYTTLKAAFTNKALFADYDKALAKHLLSASPNFITCLSPQCGKHFSTELCHPAPSRSTKHQVSCPYCTSSLCLTCNRPWHAQTGCSQAASAENAASLARIKSMGAKPCPQCGANIEKTGGCDHMTCHACRHGFCWVCLVAYTADVVHLEGCPHGRRDVAVDPRNWAPDDMPVEQVNALIEQAGRRLDGPGHGVGALQVALQQQQGQMAQQQHQGQMAQAQMQAPWTQFIGGGMAGAFFNFIAGGQGGR